MTDSGARVNTQFIVSKDQTSIAYDVVGSGPVVILLHGGGQDRQAWHRRGYVTRLAQECTAVTIDIRGNGDSDKPAAVAWKSNSRAPTPATAISGSMSWPRLR